MSINAPIRRGWIRRFSRLTLLRALTRKRAQTHEREHVTPFFYQNPEVFKLRSYEERPDLSEFRWTLDTPEDWVFMQSVYAALQRDDHLFLTADVLKLLNSRPELTRLNAHVAQKKLGQ